MLSIRDFKEKKQPPRHSFHLSSITFHEGTMLAFLCHILPLVPLWCEGLRNQPTLPGCGKREAAGVASVRGTRGQPLLGTAECRRRLRHVPVLREPCGARGCAACAGLGRHLPACALCWTNCCCLCQTNLKAEGRVGQERIECFFWRE